MVGIELERKYLIYPNRLPPLDQGHSIVQGYLSQDPVVRVRIVEAIAFLTIKGPGNISREEFEYVIPKEDGCRLIQLCKATLSKIRYEIQYAGYLWTIDKFKGDLKGLWLAEVELTSETEEFVPPSWIAKEVTYNPAYSNANLAVHGTPLTLAFTLGRTSSYDAALLEKEPAKKIGKREDYPGGWVWKASSEAEIVRQNLRAYDPDWDPSDFSIYDLELPYGWLQDVSTDPGPDGVHHLLVDAIIVRKCTHIQK